MAIQKLINTYASKQKLKAKDMTDTTGKVNELVDAANAIDGRTTDLELKTNVEYLKERTLYLGSNLVTSATATADFTGSYPVFNHISGSEGIITTDYNTIAGKKYVAIVSVGSASEGSVSVCIGDGYYVDTYNGNKTIAVGFISDGGNLKVKVTSSYSSTISNIELRELVVENSAEQEMKLTIHEVNHGQTENEITSFWNVAIGGSSTFSSAENASRNIAIGNSSMPKLRYGARNISIGTYSMSKLTDGERNVAIGADSLYMTEHCNDAVAVGKAAMGTADVNVRYDESVAIGYESFKRKSAEGSVAIGHSSGMNVGTNVKNCVAIGKQAQVRDKNASSTTNIDLENSIAIGYKARADKSNQCVIGNTDIQEVCIGPFKLNFTFANTEIATKDISDSATVTLATINGNTVKINNIVSGSNLFKSVTIVYNGTQYGPTVAVANLENYLYVNENATKIELKIAKNNIISSGQVAISFSYNPVVNWVPYTSKYQG